MPTIVGNYQKIVTVNQLKIAYQIFSEAIQRAIIEHSDDGRTIDVEGFTTMGGDNPRLSAKFIDPYIKDSEKYKTNKNNVMPIYNLTKSASNIYGYSRNSAPICIPKGFCYWVNNHSNIYAYIIVDLNGPKSPNVMGKDVFAFDILMPQKIGARITLPYPVHGYNSYDEACNKTSTRWDNGLTCAAKIINDGWKIAPDYPW